jgi:glycerate kinase
VNPPARPRAVVAPDAFKGSASAREVAGAIVAGLRDGWGDAVELIALPVADGGEGTVDVFLAAGARERSVTVSGPLGLPVRAGYALRDAFAVIEMAAASGLPRAGPAPRIWDASTTGTGELLRDALDRGASQIVLGIGGSATNDGGAGALAALGVRFLDAAGAVVPPTPAGLRRLAAIDADGLDRRLAEVRIDVACDVVNPLLGPAGASAVYGPQKGAGPADVPALDAVLARYATLAVAATGRDLRDLPGSGAAGGLGYGLATFAGARLGPGFPLIARACGLPDALQGARWCFSGEGRIDAQTLSGKVIDGIAALARDAGVPVIAFGGSVEAGAEAALALRGVTCIPIASGPLDLAQAMREAPALIRAAAARCARLLRPV